MNANGCRKSAEYTWKLQDAYGCILGISVRHGFPMGSYAVKMVVSCFNSDNADAYRTPQTKGMVPSLMYFHLTIPFVHQLLIAQMYKLIKLQIEYNMYH